MLREAIRLGIPTPSYWLDGLLRHRRGMLAGADGDGACGRAG